MSRQREEIGLAWAQSNLKMVIVEHRVDRHLAFKGKNLTLCGRDSRPPLDWERRHHKACKVCLQAMSVGVELATRAATETRRPYGRRYAEHLRRKVNGLSTRVR